MLYTSFFGYKLIVMKSAIKLFLAFCLVMSLSAFARVDNRTYTHHVDTLAVWVNPKGIKVYVEPANKSQILERAINIWDGAMRSDMNFVFVNNKNDADISLAFVDQLDGNKLGIAESSHIQIQGKIYLYKVNISIARKDPMGFINNDAEILKTALHEIEHGIGILGHSNSINDIMYYSSSSTKSTSPSLRDIDTVNKLYGF